MTAKRSGPERLTDGELKAHLKNMAAHERTQLIEWLRYLGEMDRRRAYVADGAPSLFAWCREVLLLSEGAAYARIRGARALRKFPVLAVRLASGELTLDAVARLAPHLTGENHLVLLDEARFGSRAVIDAIVARFQPPGPRRARIVARVADPDGEMAAAGPVAAELPQAMISPGVASDELALVSEEAAAKHAASAERLVVPDPMVAVPLEYRVHVTISAQAHDDLERLRELMRHQVPDGDPAAIVELALRALRSRVEARAGARGVTRGVRGVTRGVRGGNRGVRAVATASGRHIPMAVRREVRERDGDRCAFRSREGRSCGERAWLEFHHLVPYARGGTATAANIELRCRAHNRYEAEREFDGFVRERGVEYGGHLEYGGGTVVGHSSSVSGDAWKYSASYGGAARGGFRESGGNRGAGPAGWG